MKQFVLIVTYNSKEQVKTVTIPYNDLEQAQHTYDILDSDNVWSGGIWLDGEFITAEDVISARIE